MPHRMINTSAIQGWAHPVFLALAHAGCPAVGLQVLLMMMMMMMTMMMMMMMTTMVF